MKTAMKLHIEDLHKIIQIVKSKEVDTDLEEIITETLMGAVINAESFLTKEKNQLNKAFHDGGRAILKDQSYMNEDFFELNYYDNEY